MKFTPAGSTILIVARATDEKLSIVVEDNGLGLPTGQEMKLFDKFTRGETESNKPGVGMGLALCKIIMEAHDGTILAENRAQGGARFIVTLPFGRIPETEEISDEIS